MRHGLCNDPLKAHSDTVHCCQEAAAAVRRVLEDAGIPVLIGGDCSITAGAVAGCLADRSDTGLLYLDGDASANQP